MRPELWDSLRHGRVAIPSVIEEALRFESPIQMVSRVARREVEVNGLRFAKGAVVIACIGAANRDPSEFAQPDSFDPARKVKRHLAFGHGIHFCIGAALARLQAEILLRAMLRRYRGIRCCDGIRIESSVVRGFKSLRLECDPA
jgi:cytochrome P450